MNLPFIKLEGLGNNYIFVRSQDITKYSLRKLAISITDVNKGIGADGLIAVDLKKEPFAMRIFNRDGSEAEMCGNGLRQAALFIKRTKFPARKRFRITTSAGDFSAAIVSSSNNQAIVKTSLGSPVFAAKDIGLGGKKDLAFNIPLFKYRGKHIMVDCVSMGNPHAVIAVDNYDFDWPQIGRKISEHNLFANGVNVHFLKVINSKRFQMRIFERGSGVTSACGSGAAACLAVGVIRNILQKKAVAVMPGGNLELFWDISINTISQVGPVKIVCRGEYSG
jgi:diaminopimelate epimerase